MQTQTSEARRWDPTSNPTRRAYCSGSQNLILTMRQEMITGTLASSKMDTLTGHRESSYEQKKVHQIHQSVSGSETDACREYSSLFRNQPDRGESCSTSQRNHESDGSKRLTDEWDWAMECYCCLPVHDKMDDKPMRKDVVQHSMDLWISFGAKVSSRPVSSKDEAMWQQC